MSEAPPPPEVRPEARPSQPRVGELLIDEGFINDQQLKEALSDQRQTGQRIGELLVDRQVISASVLVGTLSKWLKVRGCVLRHGLIDPALFKLVGEQEATRLKAIPMFKVREHLTVAMAEPQSLPAIDRLRAITGCRIRPVLALEANIREYIKKYASGDVSVDSFLSSLTESDVTVVQHEVIDEGPTTDLDKMVAGSPIVNLVNIALLTAVRDQASDIHIEPDRKGTRIRYRIDGVLRDLMKPPAGMHAAIASRVKVMGSLDIAEKRLPQEGRIRIAVEGREVDIRVSSMPTLLGEKMVLRVLDKKNLRMRFSELGMRDEAQAAFERMLKQSHGLVLVTGPTGSGKTTTLYSALDLLRSPEVNIVTVEDPVEYQLDLINQIQVHQSIGLDFARTLRSILRQDPDVIMVGEIRDEETARVALQAALTGHLVLATLHTNDAPGAVSRMLDMGIESYLLASALNGAVAQRLLRTNCAGCQTRYYPDQRMLIDANLPHETRPFRKGAGCQQCHNSGYKGRIGIYEVLEITGPLRRLVNDAAAAHELRGYWRQHGGVTLREEAVILSLAGRTSLEEALRATQDEKDDKAPKTVAPQAAPEVISTNIVDVAIESPLEAIERPRKGAA